MTKRTMVASVALLSLVSIALAAPAGPVGGVIHKVTDKGETYEDLAEHYYGKRYLAAHLRLFNRRPEPLARGSSIIIPTYTLLAVKPKQTLKEFAEQNLADPARAEYLAELHDLRGKDKIAPKPGTRLKVVQSLKHLVRPGESLKTIARLYYRDAGSERTKLLILYNKMPNGAVKAGMSLRIPLDSPEFNHAVVSARAKVAFEIAEVAVASASEKSPAQEDRHTVTVRRRVKPVAVGTTAASGEKEKAPLELDEATESLERACDDGDYEDCETDAKKLFDASPAAPTAVRVELLRLRACALIALNRIEESKDSFRMLLKLDPEYDLDLYRTSPKILDVFQAVAER